MLRWHDQRVRASDPGKSVWSSVLWGALGALLLGALLAKWTWVLLAPRSASVPVPFELGASAETGRLFGEQASSGISPQATVLPNMRLIGVFAGVPGFAILELDGNRQIGVALGNDVILGAKLEKVAIDHVVIERGGVRQRVPLEGKTSAINSATAAVVGTIPPPASVGETTIQPMTSSPAVQSESGVAYWKQMQQRAMRGRAGY